MRFLATVCVLSFQLILCTWGIAVEDLAEGFKREEIIPDVLDTAPKNFLPVTYNNKEVEFASELTPTEVKDAPTHIGWGLDPLGFYTLIMNDPDAPFRHDPFMRECLHWIVTNIPGDDFSKGETIVEYLGASPPKNSGIHRYTFTVFKQAGKQDFNETHIDAFEVQGRLAWSLRKFVEKHNLGDPVSGNMFHSQYDDYVPEVHAKLGIKF